MGQLDRGAAAVLGAGTGLVVLALLYAFDARIRRKGVAWTSQPSGSGTTPRVATTS